MNDDKEIIEKIKEKARCFYKQENYEEVLVCYKKILADYPVQKDIRCTICTLICLDKFDEIINLCNAILISHPEDSFICSIKVFIVNIMQEKYKEAFEHFDRAFNIDPEDKIALSYKGQASYEIGKYKEAIEYFDRALKIDTEAEVKSALSDKEKALYDLGKYFDRALKIHPEDEIMFVEKGDALKKLGRYEEAIKCFDKALEIDPEDLHLWEMKSHCLRNQKKYEKALSCYKKVLEMNHEYPIQKNIIYNLWCLAKDYEALELCNKQLRIYPEDDVIWSMKGLILNEQKKFEEAIKCFDKALKLKSEYSFVFSGRGESLYELGKYEEAIENFNKALKIDNENEIALSYNGKALLELGKYREAFKYFEKLRETNPSWFKRGEPMCSPLRKYRM
ncbi:MAG: tetratricopeptide repeat protein [Candidatus Eremiobacterota bacterium]